MSINYTSLLALIQPVDGTEVGVWGDDVNNGVSSILDVAVAGTQNITTDANVTLTITQATSSGTNLSSTSAQYAILLLSGARTATRTVTLPASSKTYTVMNSTTGGYAQTVGGLTIAVGEYCTIAYNTSSSTWVKTSTQSGSGVFTTVTATVAYQGDFSNSTLLSRTLFTTTTANSTTGIYAVPSGTATAASWQATNAADPTNASKILIATNGSTDVQLVSGRNGTGTYLPLSFYTNGSQQAQLDTSGNFTLSNGNITLSGGTANGVAYLNGSKVLTTGSALTFDGTNLSVGGTASNQRLNVIVPVFTTSASGGMRIGDSGSNYYTDYLVKTDGSANPYVQWSFASHTLAQYWYGGGNNYWAWYANNSEQMRLTSTGLGIGYSTMYGKLNVNSMAAPASSGNMNSGLVIGNGSSGTGINIGTYDSGTTATSYGWISAAYVTNAGITNSLVLQPNGGNLGLGVTPSASSQTTFQVGAKAVLTYLNISNGYTSVGNNWIYNSGDKYIATGTASTFSQTNGAFYWYTAPSGTAGNAISFTQAATLTANGNYLVGTTTENSGSGGIKVAGQFALTTSQSFTTSGTVNSTAYYVVCYSLLGTCTLTLPPPSTNTGRILNIVVQSAQQVVSASSNVTKITDGTLTTAILPATAGKWAQLWCDGTYWNIIATNV